MRPPEKEGGHNFLPLKIVVKTNFSTKHTPFFVETYFSNVFVRTVENLINVRELKNCFEVSRDFFFS